MGKPKRKTFNTSLDHELLKELKILAAIQDRRINELLEEAIIDLLGKHRVPPQE